MFEGFANRLRVGDGNQKVVFMNADMITELRKVNMMTVNLEEPREVLLSIHDLHVWYELRRFGFGHASAIRPKAKPSSIIRWQRYCITEIGERHD